MRCDIATIFHRLPDRHEPRRRSGVCGQPQPIRDAQSLAEDVLLFRIARRAVPVHQQPQDRRSVQPQTRRQVGGQLHRTMPQPRQIARVRGELDPRSPNSQQQRGDFVVV